jgi:hypothetical protein
MELSRKHMAHQSIACWRTCISGKQAQAFSTFRGAFKAFIRQFNTE